MKFLIRITMIFLAVIIMMPSATVLAQSNASNYVFVGYETSDMLNIQYVFHEVVNGKVESVICVPIYEENLKWISMGKEYMTNREFSMLYAKNPVTGSYDALIVTQYTDLIRQPNNGAASKSSYTKKIVMQIGVPYVEVNGRIITGDAAPVIRNSRTMLPIRIDAENLKATVMWDEDEKRVTIISGNGDIIEVIVDSTTAYLNGKAYTLDSPAFIMDSRTYLPVKFVCDCLGAEVLWDGEERSVTITR